MFKQAPNERTKKLTRKGGVTLEIRRYRSYRNSLGQAAVSEISELEWFEREMFEHDVQTVWA
jgi:hypothetical protein